MTRILLTNDDGIHAPGLAFLRRALEGLGEIATIAPERDRSAIARGISAGQTLRLVERRFGGGSAAGDGARGDGQAGAFAGLAVNGTPVDCVRVALLGVLRPVPDLVVSGINFGANMGNDVTYSGTVGAVLEAALHSVPGIAFSVESREPQHVESALPAIHDLVARLLRSPLPIGTALNVNLPDRPATEFRGFKLTSLGGSSHWDRVVLETGDGASGEHWLHNKRAPLEPWAVTDFDAVEDGYVSLTPIHCELTSREGLMALGGWPLDTPGAGEEAALTAAPASGDRQRNAPKTSSVSGGRRGNAPAAAPASGAAEGRTASTGTPREAT